MTADLFDTLTENDWLTDPLQSLVTWESAKARRKGKEMPKNTLVQYQSMLRKALTWMREARPALTLKTVSAEDLDRYLATIMSKPKGEGAQSVSRADDATVDRHLKRLQVVFSAFCEAGGRQDNPATQLISRRPYKKDLYSRSEPKILTRDQWDDYISWTRGQPLDHWVDVRDLALLITFMATGVTVYEIRTIRLQDVDVANGTINIPGHGNVAARKVPISAWGLEDISRWYAARISLKPTGQTNAFFLGRPRGRPSDKVSGAPMSESSIYELVAAPFAQFQTNGDVFDERTGPQTLRNSYIARQLHLGIDPIKLRDNLGLHTLFSLDQIRKILELHSWKGANL